MIRMMWLTVVDSWMHRLGKRNIIRFQVLFDEDVAARKAPPLENDVNERKATIGTPENTVKLNDW